MSRLLRLCVRPWRILLGILLALIPILVLAGAGHTLTVRLRDHAGNGVAGVQVAVRDATSERDLASTGTDTQGVAMITGLEATTVRVVIAGMLPDGTTLVQRGMDAPGLWLRLDGITVQLDLRIEPDGAVVPDPATMFAPEPGLQVLPTPSGAEAATPTWNVPGVPASRLPVAPPARSATWERVREILLGILLLGSAAAVWLTWGRRRI